MVCKNVGCGFCAFDISKIFETGNQRPEFAVVLFLTENRTFASGFGQDEIMEGMRFVFHFAVALESGVEIGGVPVAGGDEPDDGGGADIIAFFSIPDSGEADREQFFQRRGREFCRDHRIAGDEEESAARSDVFAQSLFHLLRDLAPVQIEEDDDVIRPKFLLGGEVDPARPLLCRENIFGKDDLQFRRRIIKIKMFEKAVAVFQSSVVDKNAGRGATDLFLQEPDFFIDYFSVQKKLRFEGFGSGALDRKTVFDGPDAVDGRKLDLAERNGLPVPVEVQTEIGAFRRIDLLNQKCERNFGAVECQSRGFDFPEAERRRCRLSGCNGYKNVFHG